MRRGVGRGISCPMPCILILTLSLPGSVMETVLTFESVDEILWFDHSNKT